MERERLGSRLGFILLSAGCAIGCGNVWKFPWMCGQYGGGGFVLLYIICLLILGLPVMTMEFAIGRAAQASPIHMYQKLERKGQKWHIHGYVAFFGNIALMAFYTVVTGWIVYYFVRFLTGQTQDLGFVSMIQNPGLNVTYLAVTVVVAFGILCFNLQGGLERITKYMMTLLMVLMVVLAIHSATLSGAAEGLKFYLIPDFSKITGTVIVGAMNQAFFTLSVGMGSMAIFGSYIGKERSMLGESVNVICLTRLSPSWRASSCSRPASPTVWRSTPAPACCLTPWPLSLPTWPAAAGGGRCSSCSWSLQPCPQCWPSARTFWPWSAR